MAHISKQATRKKVPHIAPEEISKEPKQIPRAILPIKKTNQFYVKTKKNMIIHDDFRLRSKVCRTRINRKEDKQEERYSNSYYDYYALIG